MGLRFRLDLKTALETAYFLGSYDRAILLRLAKVCQPGWVVWDCGAYLGFYTAIFARWVGSQGCVVAFEPDPNNMARVRENLALNGFTNVQLRQAAIGGANGATDFILSNNTNSHLPGTYVGATREQYESVERCDARTVVRCLTLDEAYLRERIPAPNLIKLDIEGAELEALSHCQRLIDEAKPLIVLELHNPDCDTAAWDFAQATGYRLEALPNGQTLQTRSQVGGTLLARPAT